MKSFSAILALYFFALAVMPCADAASSDSSQAQLELIADHDHSGHEHPPGEDLCSPFCICHCCHTPVVQSTGFQLPLLPTPETDFKESFIGRLLQPLPLTILQPPQH